LTILSFLHILSKDDVRNDAGIQGVVPRNRSETEVAHGDLSVSHRAACVNRGRPVSFQYLGEPKGYA
jgi:hypothetical protein